MFFVVCIFGCLLCDLLTVGRCIENLAPPGRHNAQEFHQLKLTDFIPISTFHLNVQVRHGGAAGREICVAEEEEEEEDTRVSVLFICPTS